MVNVPVLSEQRVSTPAISSMDSSRDTIAPCFDSESAPSAMVTENTAGIATGIEATRSTRTNCNRLAALDRSKLCRSTRSRKTSTAMRITTRTTARMIRKLPIWNMAFCA